MRINRIEDQIRSSFKDIFHFSIEDESHNHAGRQGQESHFKILLVSNAFVGQTRVARQRALNELLRSEFDKGLHALTMRVLTVEEFESQRSTFQSPNCQSKNKV